MTLINNEIKDNIKVIKLLENREILLKGTARKIAILQGGYLLFLKRLRSQSTNKTVPVIFFFLNIFR